MCVCVFASSLRDFTRFAQINIYIHTHTRQNKEMRREYTIRKIEKF